MKDMKTKAIKSFNNTEKKSIQKLDKLIYRLLIDRCEMRNGEFITQVNKSELVNRCYDSYTKVHGALTRMERLGFIKRKYCINDLQSTCVYNIKKIW